MSVTLAKVGFFQKEALFTQIIQIKISFFKGKLAKP